MRPCITVTEQSVFTVVLAIYRNLLPYEGILIFTVSRFAPSFQFGLIFLYFILWFGFIIQKDFVE